MGISCCRTVLAADHRNFGLVVGKATAIATKSIIRVCILKYTTWRPISNKLTPIVSTNVSVPLVITL